MPVHSSLSRPCKPCHVHLLPAGCTSRLPESLDPSWSLIAVHGAGQWLLHVLDGHPSLPFPHTGLERPCGRSPLTRYGALIIPYFGFSIPDMVL
jgi:hypothetical protein